MIILLDTTTITTAVTGVTTTAIDLPGDAVALSLMAVFTYGSSGTDAKFWIQTSMDGGTTYHDIANFAFTTSSLDKIASINNLVVHTHKTVTDVSLADNSIDNGVLGDKIRVKYTTTGTYAGSTKIKITAVAKSLTMRSGIKRST